jgi:hypothetical protein
MSSPSPVCPAASAAAAASSSSAASPASSRSPLYRDALSSVLAFLSLRELAAALSVNKEWNSAVHSMRPALLSGCIFSPKLDALLLSPVPLLRHVGRIGDPDEVEHELWLQPGQLIALAHAFPQLQSLHICLQELPRVAELLFSPRLQCLELILHHPPPDDQLGFMSALFTSIVALQQLHTLRLELRIEIDATSVAPLQQLPLLRDLELLASFPNAVQFAAELHALPWLHRLHLTTLDEEKTDPVDLFNTLLRDATEEQVRLLQWRDFVIVGLEFTDELTPLLLRLRLLERLEATLSLCTRFDFLVALPRLTNLELHLWGMQRAEWLNLLHIFTSNGLTHLRTLVLRGGPCNRDDLVQVLFHTPSLTSLELDGLQNVDSLSFFEQSPKLAATLTQLTLFEGGISHLTAAHLPSLLLLQQLRTLRLLRCSERGSDRLNAENCAPFAQSPCIVLPHLKVFERTTRSSWCP